MSMLRASSRCLETAQVICFATSLARRLGTATVLGLAAVSVQAQSPVAFPMQYVAQQDGRRDVLVPEAFELATILLVTSEWGRGDGRRNFFTGTPYYEDVLRHFTPHRNHPVFAVLAGINLDNFNDFVGFRENSFAYAFDGDKLIRAPFLESWWNRESLPDHFGAHLGVIEDFARVSRYREFYASHAGHYASEIAEFTGMVDLSAIQAWLEQEYPARFNATKVLFSPLIRGNHSASIKRGDSFSMLWTVVAGPSFARLPSLAGGDLALLRQVFTEIDHGFVDPVSVAHMASIRAAFSRANVWYGDPQGFYAQPFASFNEYMTWATMLLYVREHYPAVRYRLMAEEVVRYMEQDRRFIAFGPFLRKLTELRDGRAPGKRLVDLYPVILAWAHDYQATRPG